MAGYAAFRAGKLVTLERDSTVERQFGCRKVLEPDGEPYKFWGRRLRLDFSVPRTEKVMSM
jgi:hypothetical protein